ncbi:YceI family protein [Flavobacterium frigoris]|uniref:Lipid/polyisoprenoid-binding YceI-like domain-containing protein n=1 Tax=Flavobacterium frigoris (strain PS1) TaxID=1086011 RepID=H7FLM3_FLAFP|nr:YceI family protein [Flavobacterium frigoris]EIA10565.1 hypothetical protein HJ01_00071 [Flavobacterium frigoris PS1]
MKKTLLLFLLLLSNTINAQEKMTTTNGVIIFEASIPFFEAVAAKNETLTCVLKTKKGTISFVTSIKTFRFKRALMEEHFNENYLESDRYPKAAFKGLIEKFDLKDIDPTPKDYYIKGKMTIHGKSRNIRIVAQIKKAIKGIELTSNFTLNTDDFNIEIPFIVRSKISKKVAVSVYSNLQ